MKIDTNVVSAIGRTELLRDGCSPADVRKTSEHPGHWPVSASSTADAPDGRPFFTADRQQRSTPVSIAVVPSSCMHRTGNRWPASQERSEAIARNAAMKWRPR